jgi:hypothetical protein
MDFLLNVFFNDEEEEEEEARLADIAAFRRRRILLIAWYLYQKEAAFKKRLNLEGRRRRDRRIPRDALLPPSDSAWIRLYESGNDQALITVTGMDHRAFNCLVELFEPWFNSHSPWVGQQDGTCFRSLDANKHGRKRLIDARTCLGLVLAWYRFRGGGFILQGWFGLTHCRRGLLLGGPCC